MTVFALLGAGALWLTYAWLLAAVIGAYLSHRKGYGERPGLASGLLLNLLGTVIWLFIPPRENSLWKTVGPFGSTVKSERHGGAGGGGGEPPKAEAPPAA